MVPARIVVLISGSGSNLQALMDASKNGKLAGKGEIVGVISNKRDAFGLVRASQAGIATVYFPFGRYSRQGRGPYDQALADITAAFRPDLIVLAGWMRILTAKFLDRFDSMVINLHPALPGQFDGTHAVERAYAAYQDGKIQHSGCMVHYAIPAVDAGPVIDSTTVPILPDDQLDDFAARMHAAEHTLIVKATLAAIEARAS